jgi:hypothetical protein
LGGAGHRRPRGQGKPGHGLKPTQRCHRPGTDVKPKGVRGALMPEPNRPRGPGRGTRGGPERLAPFGRDRQVALGGEGIGWAVGVGGPQLAGDEEPLDNLGLVHEGDDPPRGAAPRKPCRGGILHLQ